MSRMTYALLLEECKGYKETGQTYSEKTVQAGNLLETLKDAEVAQTAAKFDPPLNYKILIDSTVKLYCESTAVYQLTTTENDILLGVRSINDRMQVYRNVEWVGLLHEGSHVLVQVPHISHPVQSIVHFIGYLPMESGVHFGVEFLDEDSRGLGTTNGLIEGFQCFQCEQNCGMFVAMDKLAKPQPCSSSISQQPIDSTPLKKGDKVVTYDDHDTPVQGTVQWIGKNRLVMPDDTMIIGIYTDTVVPDINKRFSKRIAGMDYRIASSAEHTKLFLPLPCFFKPDHQSASQEHRQGYSTTNAEHLDDILLDRETQEKILEDIRCRRLSSQGQENINPQHDQQQMEGPVQMQDDLLSKECSNDSQGQAEPLKQQNQNIDSSQNIVGAKRDVVNQGNSSVHDTGSASPDGNVHQQTTTTQLHLNLAELEKQIKQLQSQQAGHSISNDQVATINTTVNKLHQDANQMERRVRTIEESIQGMNTSVCSTLQMALDLKRSNESLQTQLSNVQQQLLNVQKSNEDLKANNSHLQCQLSSTQNQLSLTQQQLLGVQSMMRSSRLWVMSQNQFTVGKEIGRGAWATVHEATFRGAIAAAKCLHDVITVPKTRELFHREMEMALICQHQNIVTFLGATMEGAPVILMELMDVNLRKAYEQEKIKDHQIHGILHDVAKALHFLHTRPDPVIHRDVSSANVLLKVLYNGEWLAKLGDLGTAKIQKQVATAGPGAIAYGAPETANFKLHSPKMDVYSFGILVMETLTKIHPYEMVDTLKVLIREQFPQYYQLVTSCTKQESSDRPTIYDVLVQLDGIATTK